MSVLHLALLWLLLAGTAACSGVTKLDYGHPFGRSLWQRPAEVVDALEIEPGARVADIGAGDGYFIALLAEAVGPTGRVYAVDVDDESLAALEALVASRGLGNVEVVRGDFDDPQLPDAGIDRVLMVNTYHHVESRPDYFGRLRGDLRPGGRVAILEPNAELRGMLSLFVDEGHTSVASELREEMRSAGYHVVQSHDFLPIQVFEVFEPGVASSERTR